MALWISKGEGQKNSQGSELLVLKSADLCWVLWCVGSLAVWSYVIICLSFLEEMRLGWIFLHFFSQLLLLPNLICHLNYNQFTMELAGNECDNECGNVPKCYSMDMSTDFIPMAVFSESSQGESIFSIVLLLWNWVAWLEGLYESVNWSVYSAIVQINPFSIVLL